MTDPYAHTSVYPDATREGYPPPADGTAPHGRSALGDVHAERPQRHPIAYLSLLLSLIALIWLAVANSSHHDYTKVQVGTQDCVSVPQDTGPNALYCRTAGLVGK